MTLEWSSSYGPVDEDFADVSLLLKGEGTNGSTTILDSSSNNLSVTVLGNPSISTAVNTPFGTGDGVLRWPSGGSGNRIEIQYNSDFLFDQDLTVEAWFYPTNTTNNTQELVTVGSFTDGLVVRIKSPFNDDIYLKGKAFVITASVTFNAWNHVALVRSGSIGKVYVNGVFTGSQQTVTGTVNSAQGIVTVGKSYFGYISNLRITKGVARYTENFDVPTAPFPILSPSTRIEVGDGFDVEAANYILAVEAADAAAGQPGGLEPAVRTAINDFVVGCKSDGIWNAIKASCILAGARTTNGALVPLKGTAPTPFNFDLVNDTDYDRKTGLVGDGSTKYLNANRLGDADPTNNEHQSIYVSTSANVSGFPQYIISFDGSTARNIAWNSGLGAYVFPNTTSSGADSGGGSPTGFIGHSRDNASTFDFFVNNTLTADINQGSSAAPNVDTFLFSFSDGSNKSNGRLAFYSIGESLDLAKLDTRISDFITAIGVAI